MSTSSETSASLRVARVDWDAERANLRAIRDRVFIAEQGVSRQIEDDGRDGTSWHFMATLDGAPVACGRLWSDGKVTRMAVLRQFRGRQIGRALLEAIVAEAGKLGLQKLYLHAQTQAADFYRRSGFQGTGAPFLEAGIAHIRMERELEHGI